VEVDHDGHRFGAQAEAFAALSAEVYEYLSEPRHVAMLYNALLRHWVPRDFNAKSLNVQKASTKIMQTIQGASWDMNMEIFDAELSRLCLVALPSGMMANVAEGCGSPSNNAVKHWLLRLGWKREKLKWGGKAFARVIFLRPGYRLENGVLYGPKGWSKPLGSSDTFGEYKCEDLHELMS